MVEERIYRRAVLSYEADIERLEVELRGVRNLLGAVWTCFNRVINSGRHRDDEELSARLERLREEVRRGMAE